MMGLWVWSVIVLVLGVIGTVVTLYEVFAEQNFRSLVQTGIGTWIWTPIALRAIRRQDLKPRWFWGTAGAVGGVLFLVPIWHHGREWKSTRTKVFGWIVFIAFAAWLAGVFAWSALGEFSERTRVSQQTSLPTPIPTRSLQEIQAERQRAMEPQQQTEREQQQRELERMQAEARAKRSILDKSRSDVKKCVALVRERSDARFHKGFSTFDAYVTGEYGESINFFGTEDERFQFKKCMSESGREMDVTNETKK